MPLISATVVKEDTSSKLGIAFERENEYKALKIKLIREDSLFAGSQLVPGLVVVSAAGKDMEGMTPKDAADALRTAPGGEEISLVCKGAVITVKKDKPRLFKKPPKLGISFKSTTNEPGKIFVSNIKEDSKFAGTDLVVGHRVLAINGKECPPKVADAVELLKGADEITLVTMDPEDDKVEPKPQVEEATVDADTEEKKDENPEATSEKEGEQEEDLTPEGNKPLLDQVFGACMC
ncbi:PDZ domain containing protein [Nitzschia inconspicua]|uniref:PDZ domain containing protein n=1 Tax=Nitzschia inconspicua TaxID=303405 RepID=A0A9K3KQW4_9STRA|nr:PDZ domain containing protein [Nitzschia inconspicua]